MRKTVKITLVALVFLAVVIVGFLVFIESDTFKVMLFDMAADKLASYEGIILKEPEPAGTGNEDAQAGQADLPDGDEPAEDSDEPPKSSSNNNSGKPDMSKFTLVTKVASPEDKAKVMGILLGLLTPDEKVKYAKLATSGMSAAQQSELSGILHSRISAGEYQTLLTLYNKYAQQLN